MTNEEPGLHRLAVIHVDISCPTLEGRDMHAILVLAGLVLHPLLRRELGIKNAAGVLGRPGGGPLVV